MGSENRLDSYYDTIIIGGGINGIGILRELSLHNQKALLIEAKNFMSQTSSRSSKMLHGGIRYLETFDFELVHEALAEKNLWVKLCPDLCKSKEFLIPIYKNSPHPLWKVAIGAKLYDALALYKQNHSRFYSKKETLNIIPNLRSEDLKGAVSYHDAIFDDYQLGMRILQSALNSGPVQAIENCAVTGYQKENHHILTLQNGQAVHAKNIVFTTGPFTDNLMEELKIPWNHKLILSKGSHIFIKKEAFNLQYPIVIQDNKRIIFLIPHEDFYLLGTTEKKIQDEEIFNIEIDHDEKDYLIKNFKRYFNDIPLTDDDILKYQAGIRPLVKDESQSNPGSVSRVHKIYSPLENCYVLLGGKWTTFRKMSADVVQKMFVKEGKIFYPSLSLQKL